MLTSLHPLVPLQGPGARAMPFRMVFPWHHGRTCTEWPHRSVGCQLQSRPCCGEADTVQLPKGPALPRTPARLMCQSDAGCCFFSASQASGGQMRISRGRLRKGDQKAFPSAGEGSATLGCLESVSKPVPWSPKPLTEKTQAVLGVFKGMTQFIPGTGCSSARAHDRGVDALCAHESGARVNGVIPGPGPVGLLSASSPIYTPVTWNY